jgi:hypothetical protein
LDFPANGRDLVVNYFMSITGKNIRYIFLNIEFIIRTRRHVNSIRRNPYTNPSYKEIFPLIARYGDFDNKFDQFYESLTSLLTKDLSEYFRNSIQL